MICDGFCWRIAIFGAPFGLFLHRFTDETELLLACFRLKDELECIDSYLGQEAAFGQPSIQTCSGILSLEFPGRFFQNEFFGIWHM